MRWPASRLSRAATSAASAIPARIEAQLRGGRELVDVLPARAGGADEADLDVVLVDDEVARDPKHAETDRHDPPHSAPALGCRRLRRAATGARPTLIPSEFHGPRYAWQPLGSRSSVTRRQCRYASRCNRSKDCRSDIATTRLAIFDDVPSASICEPLRYDFASVQSPAGSGLHYPSGQSRRRLFQSLGPPCRRGLRGAGKHRRVLHPDQRLRNRVDEAALFPHLLVEPRRRVSRQPECD